MTRRTLFQCLCALFAPVGTPNPKTATVTGVVVWDGSPTSEPSMRFTIVNWGAGKFGVMPGTWSDNEVEKHREELLGCALDMRADVAVPSDGDPVVAENVREAIRELLEDPVYCRTELPWSEA